MRAPGSLSIDYRPWIIALFVLGTFSIGIRNQFVWDDFDFILRNAYLHDLGNIPRFLFSGDAAGTGFDNPYYRPLTTATFALDYALWGGNPAGFHATNVALHLLTCIVLYRTLLHLTAAPSAALGATLLFSVHPAHSEPVGYISARADILCALFMLLSLLQFLRAEESGNRRHLALSLASFVLALLSKIVALVLPPLLILHLIWAGNRTKSAKTLLPFAALSIAFLILRSRVLVMEAWGPVSFHVRAASAGPYLLGYIRNALAPVDLKVFCDVPLRSGFSDPAVLASWLCIGAIGVATLLLARRRPLVSFGIAWFFAALLPVCGLVTILFPARMADRYLYIPLLGLAFVVASVWKEAASSGRSMAFRKGAVAVIGVLVLAAAAGTALRLQVWRDSLAMWSTAVADAPGSLYAKNGLAATYMEKESFAEAERILNEVIAIRDDNAQTRINLAGIEFRRGNLDKMEVHVNRALELRPLSHVALTYLGVIKARKGWTREAMLLFQEALRLNPSYDYARENIDIIRRHLPAEESPRNGA
ncbi:MAG TPA: glycosyltransferase family 39 protein [Candidatus Deferrimicrobiaceae bacterium]|jgi:tetratricopeptide (TPR) repeat protein